MITPVKSLSFLGKWSSAVILCVVLLGGCSGGKKEPGEAEFEAANKLLTTSSAGAKFGNSPASIEAAGNFSASVKRMQALLFSGGSGKSFATKGDFLTYVHCTDKAVVVLCHVPELRNYKDASVRESLAELAWANAQMAAEKLPGVTPSHTLVVGLRGFASYGPIWEGPLNGDPKKKTDSALERDRLYPFFAPVEKTAPAVSAPAKAVEPATVPAS